MDIPINLSHVFLLDRKSLLLSLLLTTVLLLTISGDSCQNRHSSSLWCLCRHSVLCSDALDSWQFPFSCPCFCLLTVCIVLRYYPIQQNPRDLLLDGRNRRYPPQDIKSNILPVKPLPKKRQRQT